MTRTLPLVPLFVALAACASAPAPVVDPELVALARTAEGVSELRLRVDASGAIEKTAVYHHDEAKVPAPVLALAKERYPGSSLLRVESELYATLGRVYELELRGADGAEVELAATASGTLVYVETALKPEQVAAACLAAANALVPSGVIEEIEHKVGPGLDETAVETRAGGTLHYVVLGADCTVRRHGLRFPGLFELPAP